MTLPLIDKQDSFEIVRDQIAAILALEVAAQMALADAASKDPEAWKLRIFTERSNPWEDWLNLTPETDRSPIVNVWYDTGSFPRAKGDPIKSQANVATYNIDCYGLGVSSDKTVGHNPGDREAAFEAQRAVRLVRNILMAGENAYLKLDRKTITATRWPQNITSFQPSIGNKPVQNVLAVRFALEVTFNEFSVEETPETLELLSVDVKRTEDGQIIAEADYQFPL